MSKRVFGELECAILHCLEGRGEQTVRQVYEALGSLGSYTTVMTVMSRMVEKGILVRQKSGRLYLYRKAEVKGAFVHAFLQRVKKLVFREKTVSLVRYLIEGDPNITEGELVELEKLIHQKRREGAK